MLKSSLLERNANSFFMVLKDFSTTPNDISTFIYEPRVFISVVAFGV